jgi:hypothetical protein
MRSSSVGALLPPRVVANADVIGPPAAPRLAFEVIHGRLLDEVAHDVATAWSASHAK